MIAAAFLTCALSLPAQGASFHPLVRGDMQVIKMLSAYWQKEHHDNGHTPSPKIIVWNPYYAPVSACLRLAGLKAWDLTPHPSETEYAVQGDVMASPIKRESVHVAWSLERIMDGAMLCALKSMVQTQGFLIAEMEDTWMDANLVNNGWFRLPFTFHGFSIYQKGRGHAQGRNGAAGEFAIQRSA